MSSNTTAPSNSYQCVTKAAYSLLRRATKLFKPVNTLIAVSAIGAMMSIGDVQAQDNNFKNTNMEITETAYGNLFIKNENDQGIEGATLTWTPVDVPGDSIPDPYTFITNSSGISTYENILVFHDTGVGVQNNYNIEVTQTRPNPSTDFTFNYLSNTKPENPLIISDFSGRKVLESDLDNYANNVAVYYADLSDLANGPYIATAIIGNKAHVNKILKVNNKIVGNLGSSAKPIQNNFKSAQENEAVYDILIQAQGYFDLTEQRTVTEGDQGGDFYTMISTTIPTPQHQDIQGIAKNEVTNNGPMAGVTAILFNQTLNEIITKTTGSDGTYTFEDVPVGSTCFISVGGVDGYYSWNNIEYTVPNSIDLMSDTIMTDASAVMYEFRPDIFQFHILKEQTNAGALTTERKFWFSPSVSSQDINVYLGQFSQYDAQTNDYTHTRTFDEDEADIKIYSGAFNTTTDEALVSTPFGDLYPTNKSFMYLGPNSYGSTAHELGQADGKSQCTGNGYLSSNPPETGPDAQDIAIGELEKMHWVDNVYTNHETYFDLNKLSETLGNKSPDFKSGQISTTGDLETNYSNN